MHMHIRRTLAAFALVLQPLSADARTVLATTTHYYCIDESRTLEAGPVRSLCATL